MTLKDAMKEKSFVVLGNTIDQEKYAAKIKMALISSGYECIGVTEDASTLDEAKGDVLDLCMNPHKALDLLMKTKKRFKMIVIQPGAGSEEVYSFLSNTNQPYIDGCVLVGLRLYAKEKE